MSGKTLNGQLSGWLEDAATADDVVGTPRAIVGPHAGYRYSGSTAAFAYQHVPRDGIKRVFILGPSHHVYLKGCALSPAETLATPIGDLPVDTDVIRALAATGKFDRIDIGVDEDEHSLEMHMPYIRKVFEGKDITVVPIMVGATKERAEAQFAELLAPYLDDPENFFVISSDFCHWGSRFRYQHYDRADGPIHKHIEKLDFEGIKHIESQDVGAFRSYLEETSNTICGRHPICLLMEMMAASKQTFRTSFVRYAQSGACKSMEDSSVSYAAGIVTTADGVGAGGAGSRD